MESKAEQPSCQLIEAWVAGIFYYDAGLIATSLKVGQSLRLRPEPENPSDPLAIEILTEDRVKLGYVPRRLNAGIARRLATGFDLRCEVARCTHEGDLVGLRFRIISFTPGDTPDPPPEQPTTPTQPWPVRQQPPYQLDAIANRLAEARIKLGRGERRAAFGELDTAMNWALDLWGLRHPGELRPHSGWSEQFAAFMRERTDPLRQRIALLTCVMSALFSETLPESSFQEPASDDGAVDLGASEARTPHDMDKMAVTMAALQDWITDYCGPPGHPERTSRQARLDWGFLSEISAVTAILSRDPGVTEAPTWAERLPVNRRERILRALFRWLRLMDDHERSNVIPVTRMHAMRALNWDTDLVIELQAQELRGYLETTPATPEAEDSYVASHAKWGTVLYPLPPVPFADKRELLQQAIDLMARRPLPRAELLALAARLRQIQPETRRRKRRRVRVYSDAALYLAECFARNAASDPPDLYVALRLLTVCHPFRRLDRWRLPALAEMAERLSQRYFSLPRNWLRNAVPPPALTLRRGLPDRIWLWRDNGPAVPVWATPAHLVQLWSAFNRWCSDSRIDWSNPEFREPWRENLHLRTLIRDQVLLSAAGCARQIAPLLDRADFDFLACTRDATHAWGDAWEVAYGHRRGTHWWYYRQPLGMIGRARGD